MSGIWSRLCVKGLMIATLPVAANAAGTYYNYGGASYQPVQYQQSRSYSAPGYNQMQSNRTSNSMSSTRYNNYSGNTVTSQSTTTVRTTSQQRSSQSQSTSQGTAKNGFYLGGGVTHENAMWKFEMTNVANSVLHYDNIAWNVLDLNGKYVFDVGSTKMQVDAGFKYGMQWGETTMVDDDVTKGGYSPIDLENDAGQVVGTLIGHALSIGASKDGNMMGYNVGLGLTDFMKWGRVRITPSVGYRYLQYKLKTKNNYGLAVTSAACFSIAGGEIQCDPAIYAYYQDGDEWKDYILWRDSLDDELVISDGTSYVETGDTYYYEQSGTSHSYKAEWAGPYVALDMVYDINQNNSVNGRFELGFPGYKSTGDQPYRWDWMHPKSVEDSAGMFSALHIGMGANWRTAISDSVAFSLGVTYDYYNVDGAEAKTYLNEGLYNQLLAQYGGNEQALLDPNTGSLQAIYLNNSKQACGGWVCKSSKEIDSLYRSVGVRVGIDARF